MSINSLPFYTKILVNDIYESVLSEFGFDEFGQPSKSCKAPEMTVQERYWKDFDRKSIQRKYESQGMRGCLLYIKDKITDKKKRKQAMQRYQEFNNLHKKYPDSYPSSLLLAHLVRGVTHRTIIPTRKK